MKRLFVLFLTAIMLIGYVPVHANAVDEPIVQTEIVSMKEAAEISAETMTICEDPGLPDNEELFAAYVQQELYGYGISAFGIAAGERLDSNEKLIYDALVPMIKKIANGKRESTSIGIGETVKLNDGTEFPGDVYADFTGITISSDNLQNVMNALLCDFPYEMYWYDKVTGIGCSIIRSNKILNVYITFAVADNYSADGNMYAVDTVKTGATANVAANAKKIVKKYADKTDYSKLVAYRDEICKLVSYNKPASLTGNFSRDNDPWQLIYVFDGDDTTNVVCEGYSKAFMYLCDLSVFSGDITCYTVSGMMNTEHHMWNIVTIGGASYLVDVTNSDKGTIGSDGRFFLAGTVGSPETGYTIKGTSYCYDAATLSFWGADDDSILHLEAENCPFSSTDEHEFGDWEIFAEPTCTQKGEERITCKKCGYYEARTLDAKGHNYIESVIAPTCTERGYTLYACICGDYYEENYVDALGHDWTVGVITKEPTELEAGIRTSYCTVCNEMKTEEIPALEHTHVYTDEVTAPTCTEQGFTTHICTICGDTNVDTHIDALGHIGGTATCKDLAVCIRCNCAYGEVNAENHTGGTELRNTKNGSCTETGYTGDLHCLGCDVKLEAGEVITVSHLYEAEVTSPTCTEKGYTTHTCIVCGDNYVDTYEDALDHSWDAGMVTKEPTEIESGIKTYTCSVCGKTKNDEIPMLDHTHVYTAVVTNPTCTQMGYTAHICICSNRYVDTYVAPLGHTGDTTTCMDQVPCERCDEVSFVHTGGTELRDALDATCEKGGYTGDAYCKGCDEKLATGEEIPALKHNFVSFEKHPYTKPAQEGIVCEHCGYIKEAWEIGVPLGLPIPVVKNGNDPASGGALLTWENDGEADYYEVYRASSSKGKYSKVATVTEAEAVITLGVGKSAYYKVNAICEDNAALSSDQSKYVKVTGKLAQPTVSVTVNNSGKPVLKWGKVTSAKKYYIYRAEEGGKETKIATVTKTTYTDSKAKPGKTYTYRVRAYGSKSSYTGAYSEAIKCLAVCAQPSISISINTTTGKPVISWKAISGAESYLIQRRMAGESEFRDVEVVTALKYTDAEAHLDTDAEYKVVAQSPKNAYDSAPSTVKKVHTTLAKPVVTFKVDDVTGKPMLTWEAVEGATEYKIYRSSKSTSSYKAVKATADLEYTDTSVSVGKGYYYKVIAIGENTKSAYSSYKKLSAKCAQPVVSLDINGDDQPVLTWEKVSGAKKYYVYRIDENGKQTTLGNTTKTSYTDKKAAVGAIHCYTVKAIPSSSKYASVMSVPAIFEDNRIDDILNDFDDTYYYLLLGPELGNQYIVHFQMDGTYERVKMNEDGIYDTGTWEYTVLGGKVIRFAGLQFFDRGDVYYWSETDSHNNVYEYEMRISKDGKAKEQFAYIAGLEQEVTEIIAALTGNKWQVDEGWYYLFYDNGTGIVSMEDNSYSYGINFFVDPEKDNAIIIIDDMPYEYTWIYDPVGRSFKQESYGYDITTDTAQIFYADVYQYNK